MQRTRVANYDDALDVIEHVNEDHTRELKMIVESIHQEYVVERAELIDLFEEGALVGVYETAHSVRKDIYVPFEIQGTLEEKLFHLAYAYSDPSKAEKETKRFLTVIDTRELTANFTRITFKNELAFPADWQGLCFGTHLKVLTKRFEQSEQLSWTARLLSRSYLMISKFLMKVLPVKIRRTMVESSRKHVRAYTLRHCWDEHLDGKKQYYGTMDIFTHGESGGSVWAKTLKSGDIIYTSGDYSDKHSALSSGQNVIFCDETAYPAAAGILEQWRNSLPPTLIIISQKSSEQAYFESVSLPIGTDVRRIVCDYKEQGGKVIEELNSLTQFDVVWGAMEMIASKQVRHYLRNTHKLKGENNLVKPYWRSDKKQQ